MAGISSLQRMLAGLSPRERKMLTGLGIGLASLFVFGVYFFASMALSDIENDRTAAIDALRTIRNEAPRIRQRQARREQMLDRYRSAAPALTSFVEQAARDSSVTVAEATDRPQQNVGRRFVRRSVNIRLRRVDLQSLANFMSRIDAAPFPVAITSIRIRKRFGESNAYDVDDMVIATWDRTQTPNPDPNAARGAARQAREETTSGTAGGLR